MYYPFLRISSYLCLSIVKYEVQTSQAYKKLGGKLYSVLADLEDELNVTYI